MDILSKEERSKRMSLIRSKWTKQEKKVHSLLKGLRIKHKMHPDLAGHPDILIENNLAVFLHWCFLHKCFQCYHEPKSRIDYWRPKIERNVMRDRENIQILRENGYRVLILWEHHVRKISGNVLGRLIK